MSAHTPGPWRVAMYLGGAWTVTSSPLSEPRGGEIVEVVYGPNGGTSKANARLIAAAPELYAACEAAIAYDDAIAACGNDPRQMSSFCTAQGDTLDSLYEDWIRKSTAALARARGES